jgi:hypothetical protein
MSAEARPWFKRRRFWLGVCLVLFVGVAGLMGVAGLLIWRALDADSPLMKPSAVASVCDWARLDPLPVPLSQVHATTQGSMMTREFEVSFEGDPHAILSWLKKSPGTSADCQRLVKPADLHLRIAPGGGATFAEITVSKNGSRVVIRAYWS